MLPDLPQDVINTIVQELVEDKPTLLQCSLASTALRSSSQKQLFAKIALYNTIPPITKRPRRITRFHRLLIANPSLGQCVRLVELRLPVDRNEVEALQSISKSLPILRSFILISWPTCPWQQIPDGVKVAIRDFFTLPNLTSARVAEIEGFPLRWCTRLESLSTTVMRPRWKLPWLRWDDDVERLDQVAVRNQPSQLREISAQVMRTEQDVKACQLLLDGAAPSLEALSVVIDLMRSTRLFQVLSNKLNLRCI